MSDRYFQLADHVGVTADGNQTPLVEIGMTIAVPTVVQTDEGPQLSATTHGLKIVAADDLAEGEAARFIDGTRIVHVADPRVAEAMAQNALFVEIDQPTKAAIVKHRKALADGVEEAGTHEPDPATDPQEYAENHDIPKGE